MTPKTHAITDLITIIYKSDIFYYSAAQWKIKPLILNLFCHDFCLNKTKNPAKTKDIYNFQPQAKAWGYWESTQ